MHVIAGAKSNKFLRAHKCGDGDNVGRRAGRGGVLRGKKFYSHQRAGSSVRVCVCLCDILPQGIVLCIYIYKY